MYEQLAVLFTNNSNLALKWQQGKYRILDNLRNTQVGKAVRDEREASQNNAQGEVKFGLDITEKTRQFKLQTISLISSYNHFHSILKLFDIPNFPFTTSEMMRDYKHGIYQLPHKLPNDLRDRTLGKQEISGKYLNAIE